MAAEDLVRRYYSRDDLRDMALGVLRAAGVDVDALRLEDLAGMDQFHAGSVAATEHLLDVLDLAPGLTLLDVGCGAGGPARMAAARHRCRVTGIDLSPDFAHLARSLTERLGLAARVGYEVGSATGLPHPNGSFARAMTNHVCMNIADKGLVFTEVRRVLEPGGLFAVYDQMRLGDGEIVYPLPWADDERSSFVETRQTYVSLLTEAGFRVEQDEDRTAANAAAGPPAPGALTSGALFGPDFEERISNNIAAAMAGTLGAVLMVARAV